MARLRPVLLLDIAAKVALVALLVHALANPDLPQYAGKAMAGRALTFPLATALVPIVWAVFLRRRPFPAAVDLLVTLPFLFDVVGNALNLYDAVDWWDDASHFANWAILVAGISIVLGWTNLPRLARFGLAAGLGAILAIGWELAEYVTFIRVSSELATAYTDTLGDLALGTLGGAVGAIIVISMERRGTVRG